MYLLYNCRIFSLIIFHASRTNVNWRQEYCDLNYIFLSIQCELIRQILMNIYSIYTVQDCQGTDRRAELVKAGGDNFL